MIYCINPYCQTPDNSVEDTYCQSCRSPLRFGPAKFQAIYPLTSKSQDFTLHVKTKVVYEVEDHEQHQAIMEVFEDDGEGGTELFERIIDLLRSVEHPGIPNYLEHFTVTSADGDCLNCLVREKIEGQSLKEYLNQMGPVPPQQVLTWLRELCDILEPLHRHGFKHLDIKPANILLPSSPNAHLVLIDFNDGNDAISVGYSPPEQADNKATIQSDFFALGRSMMHLLTGKQPLFISKDNRTRQLQWQTDCPIPLPPHLEQTIEQMVQPNPQDRPQTAQEILLTLDWIDQEQKLSRLQQQWRIQRRMLLGLGVGAGVLLTILLYWFYPSLETKLRYAIAPKACQTHQNAQLSCGEKSLTPGNNNPKPWKEKGMEAYAAEEYTQAVDFFKRARLENPTDPEVLIFLNNAKIQSEDCYTIAIAAPLKTDPYLTNYILRGIAQFQDEVNNSQEKINGRSLRILLANDGNDEASAQTLARQLAKMENLIAVVGHYASEISLATLPIYQKAQIPMISFGSTSRELTCNNRSACPQNVFFRAVVTTSDGARALAYYANSAKIHQKVAVFYNKSSSFSRSLKTEFDLALKTFGGTVVYETSLCSQGGDFNLDQIQSELSQKQVSAIALFPDGQTCKTSMGNVRSLMNRLKGEYPILNNGTFHNSGFFHRVSSQAYQQVITGSQWHYLYVPPALKERQTQFKAEAQALWGDSILSDNGLTGITATTYDATKVVVEALKDDSVRSHKTATGQRQAILQLLRTPDLGFSVQGLTGQIEFQGSDRKDNNIVILRTVKPECGGSRTNLVPLDYDEMSNPTLCPGTANNQKIP